MAAASIILTLSRTLPPLCLAFLLEIPVHAYKKQGFKQVKTRLNPHFDVLKYLTFSNDRLFLIFVVGFYLVW